MNGLDETIEAGRDRIEAAFPGAMGLLGDVGLLVAGLTGETYAAAADLLASAISADQDPTARARLRPLAARATAAAEALAVLVEDEP